MTPTDLAAINLRTDACRGCGARIFFAKTRNDKTVPLDIEPDSEGTYIIAERDPLTLAKYDPELHAGRSRYVSHFVTCPDRDAFSKHRKGRRHHG